MTIIAPGAVLPAAGPDFSARRPGLASSFTVPVAAAPQASGPQASGQAGNAARVVDAGAMLALQEEAGWDADHAGASSDREARRHGQEILEALAALQRDLLTGNPAQGLSRLAILAEMAPGAHDPALARVLSSIRLRARLEILRLTPRPSTGQGAAATTDEPPSMTGM